MDVLQAVERFLVQRKKLNKRRKEKKDENPFIEIRTKSGLSILGDIHGLTEREVKIREFVVEQKVTSSGYSYSNNHYTGRVAIIDRQEVETVFAGQAFTAP
ncbi:MAG: hypothetical protein Q7S34_01920 [bacterium]|nr:hypothetical protein [bacterium]